ncbi:hypothetical protein HY025_00875 [Candidatus Daviesbacteria bacterium]|nr:hypothetical protein [Candidatus Daviesbacteria bacterium]
MPDLKDVSLPNPSEVQTTSNTIRDLDQEADLAEANLHQGTAEQLTQATGGSPEKIAAFQTKPATSQTVLSNHSGLTRYEMNLPQTESQITKATVQDPSLTQIEKSPNLFSKMFNKIGDIINSLIIRFKREGEFVVKQEGSDLGLYNTTVQKTNIQEQTLNRFGEIVKLRGGQVKQV